MGQENSRAGFIQLGCFLCQHLHRSVAYFHRLFSIITSLRNAHHACRKARRRSDADDRLPYMRSPMRKTLARQRFASAVLQSPGSVREDWGE